MTSTDDRLGTEDSLSKRVAHLQNAMHKLGADVIRLQTQLTDLAAAPPQAPGTAEGTEDETAGQGATPFIFNMSRDTYKSELAELVTWVNTFLAPVYIGDDPAWCSVWWEHHEAVGRLHALRLAYRELVDTDVSGPSGPSAWHRDHLDPTLERLRSATGPFAGCRAEGRHLQRDRSRPA